MPGYGDTTPVFRNLNNFNLVGPAPLSMMPGIRPIPHVVFAETGLWALSTDEEKDMNTKSVLDEV